MLHTIKRVKYIEEYKLMLFFDDGSIKLVDFKERLKNAKNMFLALKDVEYFKKVKADGTTVVWPNGLDLCPDVLYERGIECIEKSSKKSTSRPRKLRKKTKINVFF